ncbi:MAG: hypothetical protein ACYDCQ_13980, partial [Dehalococcoidia bacterium]
GSPSPGPAAVVSAANLDQVAVVLNFFDALNHGDADAAAASFADNGFMVGAAPKGLCSLATPCYDNAAIHTNMNLLVKIPNLCETVTSVQSVGGFVTGRVEVRQDGIRANGIERVVQSFLVQVQDGQILAYFGRNDLADPQTAANIAIAAGQQARGTALPTPNPSCD